MTRAGPKAGTRHEARAVCQLYLVMEVHSGARDQLLELLAHATIPSVLFCPPHGGALTAPLLKPLIDLAQSKDTAALVLDNVALARALRADGVHLSAGADIIARFDDARSVLGAGAIIGADAGGSRHVALELGEAGAEYVGFGRDGSLTATSSTPASANSPADVHVASGDEATGEIHGPLSQRDLIAWWSEVLEVPCVAFDVADVDGVSAMADAGADFVAVKSPVEASPAAVVDWFANLLRAVEPIDA